MIFALTKMILQGDHYLELIPQNEGLLILITELMPKTVNLILATSSSYVALESYSRQRIKVDHNLLLIAFLQSLVPYSSHSVSSLNRNFHVASRSQI